MTKYQYAPCYEANNVIHVLGYVTSVYDDALKEVEAKTLEKLNEYKVSTKPFDLFMNTT